ncbi:MAG: hypothetical protein JSU73_02315 [candidate division WOR-3 bacterium]|nr:MAG: hypothetical protein JSU73_02315 [candidate division WOR-3 bacterium]
MEVTEALEESGGLIAFLFWRLLDRALDVRSRVFPRPVMETIGPCVQDRGFEQAAVDSHWYEWSRGGKLLLPARLCRQNPTLSEIASRGESETTLPVIVKNRVGAVA